MADKTNILVGAGTLKVDDADVGFTEDGVTVKYDRGYYDVEADQSLGILEKKKIRQRCTVVTNLLEATLENLKIVWDVENAVGSEGGKKTLSFGGDSAVTEHTLEFNGIAPGSSNTRKFYVWKAVSIEAGEHAYKKGEKTVIPVTFEAIMDLTKPVKTQYGYFEDTV